MHGRVRSLKKSTPQGEWKTFHDKMSEQGWGPINSFFLSMFCSCIVKINDKEIGQADNQQYVSQVTTTLGAQAHVMDTILLSRLFVKDSYTCMEAAKKVGDKIVNNEGLVKRRNQFADREWVDFQV